MLLIIIEIYNPN